MPSQVDQGSENELSRLGIKQEILFDVHHAQGQLSSLVTNAVESALLRAPGTFNNAGQNQQPRVGEQEPPATAIGIPSMAVDEAIRSHHVEQHASYSFYLVYPGVHNQYRYQYVHHEATLSTDPLDGTFSGQAGGSGREGDNSERKRTFPASCGYVGWVGERHRYAWLDLGAYVSSGWGPWGRALGVVSPSTFPDVTAAMEAMLAERNYAWIYPELAALTHRTASQLIVPPLLFTPAGLGEDFQPLLVDDSKFSHWADFMADSWQREEVIVQMYLVCDETPCPATKVQAWEELERLLREPAAADARGTGGSDSILPEVTVTREEVGLLDSPLLATGLLQAVRSRRGGPNVAVGRGVVTLATDELRHWLRLFLDAKSSRERGSKSEQVEGEEGHPKRQRKARVIPLFVLSLDTSDTPVLLEHSMRSTVFPDMVISVAATATVSRTADTVVGTVDSAFQCEGRHVVLPHNSTSLTGVGSEEEIDDNRDSGTASVNNPLLRETIASLAQAIWGARPRALSWDPLTEVLGTDYLWATGASIFTPLSSHAALTFVERDAYVRTHILRRVNAAIGEARDVLKQAAAVEPLLVLALVAGDHARAADHWRGVQDNLDKCLHHLAIHEHESAIPLVRSLEKHVAGLEGVLRSAYGGGVYKGTCLCGAEGGGGWGLGGTGAREALGVSRVISNALFTGAALVLCATFVVRRCFGRGDDGWGKRKRN